MLIFLVAVACVLVGLAVKFAADFVAQGNSSRYRRSYTSATISWREFAVGVIACFVIVAPVSAKVGSKLAVNNQVNGYQEFWNGVELLPVWERTRCERDGSCVHDYQCDPYTVLVTKTRQVYAGTDSKGNSQYRTETYTEPETRYHQCPYTTEEWTFTVKTTIGDFTVEANNLPTNPDQHRWRASEPVPGYRSGVPQLWLQAKARHDAGTPGPVTGYGHKYTNYILASQRTILKEFSGDIDRYKKAKLLPVPARENVQVYLADKVYVMGGVRVDERKLIDTVNRLNAALGTERQGDLHLVIVPAVKAGDPATYKGALNAYWQGPELGKRGVAKNAVVLILGADADGKVAWSRAFTGMPVGNERPLGELERTLTGKPISADLIGAPAVKLRGDKPVFTHTAAPVDRILFAAGENGFIRISMNGGGKDDNGSGFEYLKGEIQPTAGQKAWIVIGAALLSLLLWGLFLAIPDEVLGRVRFGRGS